jgi:hypothetical protein
VLALLAAFVFAAASSRGASPAPPPSAPRSSVELLVTLLLAIAVPVAAFIRPSLLENPSRWPFGETARHFWCMTWVAVVCCIAGFSQAALTSTKAFETPSPRLYDAISAAVILLFFVFVMVHVLPLLEPVNGLRRRLATCVCVIFALLFGLVTGTIYATFWLEIPHESNWRLLLALAVSTTPVVVVALAYALRLVAPPLADEDDAARGKEINASTLLLRKLLLGVGVLTSAAVAVFVHRTLPVLKRRKL